jgi:long-chain fatty acid transport protein
MRSATTARTTPLARLSSGLGVTALTLLLSSTALGSGFATARFGAEHGYAATSDPTALYYNPAALTLGRDTQVMLDVTAALRNATYERSPTEAAGTPEATGNFGTATLQNVMAAPSVFAAAHYENVSVALGLFAPFGGTSSYDEDSSFAGDPLFVGAVDGVSRWHNIEGRLATIYFSGGAAAEFGPVSLGLALNAIYSSVETLRARTGTGEDDSVNEGRSLLTVDGWNMSVGLGALVEAIENELWLGVSYQSMPDFSSEQVLDGTLLNSFSSESAASLHQSLPDIIRGAIRIKPNETVELRVFGDYTRWSVMETQCVAAVGNPCHADADGAPIAGVLAYFNRDWSDGFGARVGASYWTSPELELFAGGGYDSNVVPDSSLEPALMDGDDIALSLGARYDVNSGLRFAGSYTHMIFANRDNRETSETLPSGAAHNPDAGGIYTHWVGILNASVLGTF